MEFFFKTIRRDFMFIREMRVYVQYQMLMYYALLQSSTTFVVFILF